MHRIILSLLLTLIISPAFAVQPGEQLADKALEARARELSGGLRCLVCQNQSIDDSDAPLAKDLRLLVRERLIAGDSDKDVRDFIVARYGEFVLLNPSFSRNTWLLWLGPFALLLAGAFALFRRGRSMSAQAPVPAPLNADEQQRLANLLENEKS